ncbi:MAG TPA: penicillin-binding protein 2 [Actinomycetes bacterium]|nr:penicillin-binding protein 2 [Actinomycetes bacterium]
MTDRSRMRLVVLQVLVLSLLVTLLGRLWFMQVVSGEEYAQAASDNQIREVVTPAVRGAILDDRGRPLVQNRTSLVVSVDRSTLLDQPKDGKAVEERLAKLLGTTYKKLDKQLTLCGTPNAPEPPVCWNGSPYQPIPVAEDVRPGIALQVMERREDFPGVTAEMTAIRDYPKPFGVNAAHLLGYLGPVTAEELDAQESDAGRRGAQYTRTDLVGRAGLEQVYDSYLRGRAGIKQLSVDSAGNVTGTVAEKDSVPGDYLVTSIDAHVQKVVEDQLKAAIQRAHTQVDPNGVPFKARTGAAVVLEADTGRVVAMASYPSYNPSIWTGGISNKQYAALSSEKANVPLINRAIQGQYAPASTFKIVSTSAAVNAGYSLYDTYPCPSSLTVAGQNFSNFESEGHPDLTFKGALEYSCDTVYYQLAYNMWLREGGYDAKPGAEEFVSEAAHGFGLGAITGVDLPGEAPGRVADREWRKQYYAENKDYYCHFDERASPQDRNNPFLQKFAPEFCADGDQYRAGDAVLSAIGQGDMLATPLQMARAYAAIANGGTLYKPQIAKAVMSPSGEVVKEFEPKAQGKIPASDETIAYIQDALKGVTTVGTAAWKFTDFPLDQIPIASKTGTGEVQGGSGQSTSWFASYAPANDPKFVVLMMVPEGGTGSGTSGPSVNAIYRALFGVDGFNVDPANAIIPGGKPVAGLPTIEHDGTIDLPRDDGLPGNSQTGLPAATENSNQTKKQQRRVSRRRRGVP